MSARGAAASNRGKRITKGRLAGMSSYEKAKAKSNAGVFRGTTKAAQKSAARKGAEGPKRKK